MKCLSPLGLVRPVAVVVIVISAISEYLAVIVSVEEIVLFLTLTSTGLFGISVSSGS